MLGPAVRGRGRVRQRGHVAPLGTGRTDEYLYPALLLLLASGVVSLWAGLREHVGAEWRNIARPVAAAVGVVVGAVLIVVAIATTAPYPGFAVQTLAAEISRTAEPTDHIVVGELARYPWHTTRIAGWCPLRPGLEHVLHRGQHGPPRVHCPLEGYEGGSHPARWADELRPYGRLWFVESPPPPSSPRTPRSSQTVAPGAHVDRDGRRRDPPRTNLGLTLPDVCQRTGGCGESRPWYRTAQHAVAVLPERGSR